MERLSQWVIFIFILISYNGFAQEPFVMVLGNMQDGGFPQSGCAKSCCKEAWKDPSRKKYVSSIAIIDPANHKSWMIDATPDFGDQLQMIREALHDSLHLPSGIFLTHAHIGHYTGLMNLGREVMGVNGMEVYAMPRMNAFLQNNGPWSQLVNLDQIRLKILKSDSTIVLNSDIRITPMLVPHRDEYSETVGFSIAYGNKKLLYIPDIDKWEKWLPGDTRYRLDSLISRNDQVLIDGTFYSGKEINGRNIKEIPHPFMEETMELLGARSKSNTPVYFIHLNHTNPSLNQGSGRKQLEIKGYRVAEQGSRM